MDVPVVVVVVVVVSAVLADDCEPLLAAELLFDMMAMAEERGAEVGGERVGKAGGDRGGRGGGSGREGGTADRRGGNTRPRLLSGVCRRQAACPCGGRRYDRWGLSECG